VRARERGRDKWIGGGWEVGVGGEVMLEGGRGGEGESRKGGGAEEEEMKRNRGMKPLHTTI
jgi:hypothetical protein